MAAAAVAVPSPFDAIVEVQNAFPSFLLRCFALSPFNIRLTATNQLTVVGGS